MEQDVAPRPVHIGLGGSAAVVPAAAAVIDLIKETDGSWRGSGHGTPRGRTGGEAVSRMFKKRILKPTFPLRDTEAYNGITIQLTRNEKREY